jgi:hypothetical protein
MPVMQKLVATLPYDCTRRLSFGALILSLLLFRLYASLILVRRRLFKILGFIIVYYGWRMGGQLTA